MKQVFDFIVQNNVQSVLDIGANAGNFSVTLKTNKPDLDIFMIEANPWCVNFLERTGIPFEIACLSNEPKEVKLYLNRANWICTGVSYYQENTQWYSSGDFTTVEAKTLDFVIYKRFGHQKKFDYIKLDTQGSELDIIRGAPKTIKAAKYVQIELSLIEYNKGAPLKDDVVNFMKELGFNPTLMVEKHFWNQNPAEQLIQEDWVFSR